MSSFDRPSSRLPCANPSLSYGSHPSQLFLPPQSSLLTSGFHRSCLIPLAYRGIGFPRKTHSLPTLEINNAAWRRCVCGSSKTKPSRHLAIALPTLILPPATLVPEYPYAPPIRSSHQACVLSSRSSHLRLPSFARIRLFELPRTCFLRRPCCVCLPFLLFCTFLLRLLCLCSITRSKNSLGAMMLCIHSTVDRTRILPASQLSPAFKTPVHSPDWKSDSWRKTPINGISTCLACAAS